MLQQLSPEARVLDYGCLGWKLVALRPDLQHHGCDVTTPTEIPANTQFHLVSTNQHTIPIQDDFVDFVVASHVLEHTIDPLNLFKELVRICKPGGRIYVETPSDRWLHLRSHPRADTHAYLSFWDDPTHVRPWPLAALYRLVISYGCTPLIWRHISSLKDKWCYPFLYLYYALRNDPYSLGEAIKSAKGLDCYIVAEKPPEMRGAPPYCYAYLKDVPAGVENAVKFYKKQTS